MQLVPFGEDRTGEGALTSVAVSLDAKQWPQRSASPEEDFQHLVRQFPDLAWQFAEASAVRPWASAESWQYAATRAVGDGFVVLDRSAVRCDFTLSRDVTLTAELVHEAAAHLIAAARDGDWSTERFRPLEVFQATLIEHGERLLRSALTATGDFRLWNAFCRVWLLHSMFAALSLKRARNDALATGDRPDQWRELGRHRGAGLWFPVYAGFVALFDDTDRLLRQVADQRLAPGAAAERIFGQLRTASFVPRCSASATRPTVTTTSPPQAAQGAAVGEAAGTAHGAAGPHPGRHRAAQRRTLTDRSARNRGRPGHRGRRCARHHLDARDGGPGRVRGGFRPPRRGGGRDPASRPDALLDTRVAHRNAPYLAVTACEMLIA
ncbi:hypothetical protein [Streptomyces galbus]|uniref:hypothetical protein n=1 Tax=Streptomyces galbus TaxID=33898 RepID=UPI003EBB423E